MRTIIFFIFSLLITGNGWAQFSGDSWEKAKQTKEANVVLTYTHAPKFAEKVGNEYKGLCFDIMRNFAEFVKSKYGITVNYQYKDLSDPKDFDLFLKTVRASSGGVFGLGDVTITSERKKYYTFSPPYFSNIAIMITHPNAPDLTSMDNIANEFAGMKAVVQSGTTSETKVQAIKQKYFPSLVIETTVGFEGANQKVAQDPKYFTYIDFSSYLDVLDKKLLLKRQSVGDEQGETFGFIMPKSNDWNKVLDEYFAQGGGFTQSLEYRKIMQQNLGTAVLRLLDAMKK